MKFNLNKRRKYLLTGGLLLATATPSFALFGIGDIVFDPTSYASLVSQLTTLESQYNMLKNNVTHFSFKQQWQTTLNALKNANVANMFGRNRRRQHRPQQQLAEWPRSQPGKRRPCRSAPARPPTCKGKQSETARSFRSSPWSRCSDSVSPDCLTAVGQYRAGRSENGPANNSLTQQQFDTTSATNSEVQQLNLLNAAQAQQLTEMQSQAAMHVCLASQMTVANMQQRNAAAQDLNTAAAVQQQRTVNDTSAANEGSTWTTYLP